MTKILKFNPAHGKIRKFFTKLDEWDNLPLVEGILKIQIDYFKGRCILKEVSDWLKLVTKEGRI